MVELIRGKVFRMSPAPSRKHQVVSMRLQNKIFTFLEGKKCQVYSAPFDVRLSVDNSSEEGDYSDTVVQPDICVICDVEKLTDQGCTGAPDWIIEILSPGSSHKDLNEKFEVYQSAGVKEYWIVHPLDKTVLTYFLNEDGKYQGTRPQPYSGGDTVQSTTLPSLSIALSWVFKE
jgi:Uma2 family endonuclease